MLQTSLKPQVHVFFSFFSTNLLQCILHSTAMISRIWIWVWQWIQMWSSVSISVVSVSMYLVGIAYPCRTLGTEGAWQEEQAENWADSECWEGDMPNKCKQSLQVTPVTVENRKDLKFISTRTNKYKNSNNKNLFYFPQRLGRSLGTAGCSLLKICTCIL